MAFLPDETDHHHQRQQHPRYVLVAEEPMQECYTALLATLTELSVDYATEPIWPENFVTEATNRLSENFHGAKILVRHCLSTLQRDNKNKRSSDSTSNSAMYLDVAKVRNGENYVFMYAKHPFMKIFDLFLIHR
jgi:hypothetical protein